MNRVSHSLLVVGEYLQASSLSMALFLYVVCDAIWGLNILSRRWDCYFINVFLLVKGLREEEVGDVLSAPAAVSITCFQAHEARLLRLTPACLAPKHSLEMEL